MYGCVFNFERGKGGAHFFEPERKQLAAFLLLPVDRTVQLLNEGVPCP